MRVLLDNCVPLRLGRHLSPHNIDSVVRCGWAQFGDGDLLDAMASRFDVLVTVDKSIPFQQRLQHRQVGLIVLRARSNRLSDRMPLVPSLLIALDAVRPGVVQEVTK